MFVLLILLLFMFWQMPCMWQHVIRCLCTPWRSVGRQFSAWTFMMFSPGPSVVSGSPLLPLPRLGVLWMDRWCCMRSRLVHTEMAMDHFGFSGFGIFIVHWYSKVRIAFIFPVHKTAVVLQQHLKFPCKKTCGVGGVSAAAWAVETVGVVTFIIFCPLLVRLNVSFSGRSHFFSSSYIFIYWHNVFINRA